MKFIELHESRGAIYVNAAIITRVRAAAEGSWIALLDNDSIYVKEDVEVVLQMLANVTP